MSKAQKYGLAGAVAGFLIAFTAFGQKLRSKI